jgi:hypothetical protein
MSVNRELESSQDRRAHEADAQDESQVQRAPLDVDDVCELQEHEFTLEPDDPHLDALDPPTPVVELPGRRWFPPLPKWAARSRALLERWASRDVDAAMTDDEPTPVAESVECSVTELRALRQELAWVTRELYARELRVEQLAKALEQAQQALAEARHAALIEAPQPALIEAPQVASLEAALVSDGADSVAALRGELSGQAHRLVELEAALRAAQLRRASEPAPERPSSAPSRRAKTAARPRATATPARRPSAPPASREGAPRRKAGAAARKTASTVDAGAPRKQSSSPATGKSATKPAAARKRKAAPR